MSLILKLTYSKYQRSSKCTQLTIQCIFTAIYTYGTEQKSNIEYFNKIKYFKYLNQIFQKSNIIMDYYGKCNLNISDLCWYMHILVFLIVNQWNFCNLTINKIILILRIVCVDYQHDKTTFCVFESKIIILHHF